MHHAVYEWDGTDRFTTTWWASAGGEIANKTTVIRLALRAR